MVLNKGVPLSGGMGLESCGCVETNLCGRMKQYTDMADVNMGGIVEMALNNGVCASPANSVLCRPGPPEF